MFLFKAHLRDRSHKTKSDNAFVNEVLHRQEELGVWHQPIRDEFEQWAIEGSSHCKRFYLMGAHHEIETGEINIISKDNQMHIKSKTSRYKSENRQMHIKAKTSKCKSKGGLPMSPLGGGHAPTFSDAPGSALSYNAEPHVPRIPHPKTTRPGQHKNFLRQSNTHGDQQVPPSASRPDLPR